MPTATPTDIAAFAGRVLTPDDAGYDTARAVFNGAIDRRPALIAQATDVDLAARTVHAGAGLTWKELDAATQAHGLAVTGGRVSHTGVAGLTLGSGSGWLERRHGLTADSLLGATVVTAEGDRVHATLHDHTDLLWGLKGGGGNFGVVTEFEFALHEVGPTVLGGPLVFEAARAAEVLAAYRDVLAGADDDLGGAAVLQLAPPAPFVPAALVGAPVLMIVVAAFGDLARAERLVAPLRALRPAADAVGPLPYCALQSMSDAGNPAGLQNLWRAGMLDALPDAAVATAVEVAADVPSPRTTVLIQPLGGAYARVDADATALSHRDAAWVFHVLSMWDGPADTPANRAWTGRFTDALAPYGRGRIHPNYVSEDAGERVRAFYGDRTFERLVAVKDRWDPANVFAANQNIRPSR